MDDQVTFQLLDRSSIMQSDKQVILAQDEVYIISKPNRHVVKQVSQNESVNVREYQIKKDSTLIFSGKIAGNNTNDLKEFEGPQFVYMVTAKNPGTCDLLCIPIGLTDSSQITTVRIVVGGLAPQPPPNPIPTPGPTPGPKPTGGIRILLLVNEDAKLDQLNAVNSLSIIEWLDNNCVKDSDGRPEWRRYDRSVIDQPGVLDKEAPLLKKLWLDVRDKVPDGSQMVIATGSTVVVKPITNIQSVLTELNNIIGVRK